MAYSCETGRPGMHLCHAGLLEAPERQPRRGSEAWGAARTRWRSIPWATTTGGPRRTTPTLADADPPPPWEILGSEVEREYSIFSIRRDRARSPRTGALHDFLVVEPAEAVSVVAVTPRDELVLVEQFRFGTRENTLELPGGVLHGDDPLGAARRELREETGYAAADVVLLGTVDLNPSWQATRIHLVHAAGAAPAGPKSEDAAEDTRVRLIPLDRARRMVAAGEIRNAVTIVGLHLLGARR